MPERVTVRDDQQIIVVESWGKITREDLEHSLRSVLDFHREKGYRNVLVDATAEDQFPPVEDIFDFGNELARVATLGIRFAIVASPKTAEDLRFLETVAWNRGGLLQVFSRMEEALSWLS